MKDLGHTCRECKGTFATLGEPLTERRGARTSSRYHGLCFSGFADPRSQSGGSMWSGKLAGLQLAAAPRDKAGSKMRTSEHFSGGHGINNSNGNSNYNNNSYNSSSKFGSKVVMGSFDFKDGRGVGSAYQGELLGRVYLLSDCYICMSLFILLTSSIVIFRIWILI